MMWVNPASKITNDELLERLGLSHFQRSDNTSFDAAMYPEDDRICIGRYQGSLIICLPFEQISEFYSPNTSDVEAKAIALFPSSEIYVSSLHSVVNHWGYCLIKNGEKLCYRTGDAENEALEFGEPLPQEKELLAQSSIDKTGARVYRLEHDPEEVYTEDQVGENFVFNIFTRYMNNPLDSADDDLFELEMEVYLKTAKTQKSSADRKANRYKPVPESSWWKFW